MPPHEMAIVDARCGHKKGGLETQMIEQIESSSPDDFQPVVKGEGDQRLRGESTIVLDLIENSLESGKRKKMPQEVDVGLEQVQGTAIVTVRGRFPQSMVIKDIGATGKEPAHRPPEREGTADTGHSIHNPVRAGLGNHDGSSSS
jgi:hypothetical protein